MEKLTVEAYEIVEEGILQFWVVYLVVVLRIDILHDLVAVFHVVAELTRWYFLEIFCRDLLDFIIERMKF